MPNKKKSANFETAFGELEEIVHALESDQLSLEEMLTRYEQAATLIKTCHNSLKNARKRLELTVITPNDSNAQTTQSQITETTAAPTDDNDLKLL